MSRMSQSLSAEFRKITATKLWWIMALVIALYSAMMAGTFAALFGVMTEGMPDTAGFSGMIYSAAASFGYVAPLLFGAIMATSELRHGILGLAFIAEPRREIVLGSKLLNLILFGFLIGIAGLVGTVGVGAPVFAALGGSTEIANTSTWLLLLRTAIALALWAVIGFGLGLIMRNQAFTIVIALVFTQFIEPTLRTGAMFWEWSASIAKFFPGSATDSFVGASLLNNMSALDPTAPQSVHVLNIWQGGLVLLALAVLVVFLGWILRWRRDVQ